MPSDPAIPRPGAGAGTRDRAFAPDADAASPGDPSRIAASVSLRSAWIAVAVCVAVQLLGFTTVPPGSEVRVFLLLAAASSFLLLASRRHAGLVVLLLAVFGAPALAFGQSLPLSIAPLAVAVVIAIFEGRRVWVWGTIAGLALVGPAMVIVERPVAEHFGLPVSVSRPLAAMLALCILVGVAEVVRTRREAIRDRAAHLARLRRSQAEAERLRIARELHDILAHSLSQISVQAGIGIQLFDARPERARAALAAIRETSSRSLDELRGVLGFLREEGDEPRRQAAPGLGALSSLFSSVEDTGIAVHHAIPPHVDLSPAEAHAVYRIAQEALTNVVRHSGAAAVDVRLTGDPAAGYRLVIEDDGRGASEPVEAGSGIVGMRERALLVGAELTTAVTATGGFRVELGIPRGETGAGTR